MLDTCDEYLLQWSRYHDFIDGEFFSDIDYKNVLEIGSFTGAQTQVLAKHNLTSLTLVEPNSMASKELEEKYPAAHVITNDIFDLYSKEPLQCDVVVCLGLLYHLHSPLYLLELIANQSSPDTIILDNVHCEYLGQGGLLPEPTNVPGNMFSNRKVIPRAVVYSFNDINSAMEDLGYSKIHYCDLFEFTEIDQKSHCWMAKWQKM